MFGLLDRWLHSRKKLAEYKASELAYRNELLHTILGDTLKGSKTTTLDGVKLRATARYNFTIDKDMLAAIEDQLNEQERACVVYKPTLNQKLYGQLPEDSVLHSAITAKKGQGSISLV